MGRELSLAPVFGGRELLLAPVFGSEATPLSPATTREAGACRIDAIAFALPQHDPVIEELAAAPNELAAAPIELAALPEDQAALPGDPLNAAAGFGEGAAASSASNSEQAASRTLPSRAPLLSCRAFLDGLKWRPEVL